MVEPDGHPCPCGNRGCLEQYASASAIVRLAKMGIQAGGRTILSGLDEAALDGAAVAKAAREGDSLARYCFATAGRYLGIAAASAVNLLNLDAIIICGGIAASFDLMEADIRRELHERAFAVPASHVKLLQGALGDDAALLGAAAAWELLS